MSGGAGLTDEGVHAAAQGSPDALARILEAAERQVRLMVTARLCPTPARLDAVDDVAQQVLFGLTEGISRLKVHTVTGLKAFASGIVARKVADLLKGRGEGKAGPKAASLDSTVTLLSEAGPLWQSLSTSGTSPSSLAARKEQASRLMTALGQVKPEHREVITPAFFDQLPVAEIAERMSLSRPAASMLLIRAVRALRRHMTGSSSLEGPQDERS